MSTPSKSASGAGLTRSPSPSLVAPSPKRQKLSSGPNAENPTTGASTSGSFPPAQLDGRPISSASASSGPVPPPSSSPSPAAPTTTPSASNDHLIIPDDPAMSDLGRSLPNGAGVTKLHPAEQLDVGGSGSRVDVQAVVDGVHGNGNGNGMVKVDKQEKDGDDDDDDDDEEEVEELPEPEKEEQDQVHGDMYLDTVARQNLEFDFERLCSKSLSNQNVYCCLICGKYFQGRGKGSWAYRHAVGEGHRVWLGLGTEKFYVLPDGYQVSDPSLQDIISVLNPRYNPTLLPSLSLLPSKPSYTLNAQPYFPGYIGLNNIRANDYSNVIVHLLLHIPPVRDYFLSPLTPELQIEARPTEMIKRFAALAKRVWNPKLFKAQVSPHEFLQEVTKRSEGKFGMTEQGDPVAFLGWLLNTLHRDLGGSKKSNSSIIYKTFQGQVRIQTQEVIVDKRASRPVFDISRDIKTIKSPFLFLALDLPPAPIFQDLNENRIIPQVPLGDILAKYDGVTTQEMGNTLKRHQLTQLPPYLILFIKRFTSNNFVKERNPTIVNFPLRGVDLKDHVDPKPSSPMASVYDLIANIPHETTSASTNAGGSGGSSKKNERDEGDTVWKVHVRAGAGGADAEKWFALQDLDVTEVRKEMVFLGETVVQVWERRDVEVKV